MKKSRAKVGDGGKDKKHRANVPIWEGTNRALDRLKGASGLSKTAIVAALVVWASEAPEEYQQLMLGTLKGDRVRSAAIETAKEYLDKAAARRSLKIVPTQGGKAVALVDPESLG